MALIQLDGFGTGALNLILGGFLYLVAYLTLAPIMSAVEKQDNANLRAMLGEKYNNEIVSLLRSLGFKGAVAEED